MPVLCEDSPLKKCGNYVIDTEASPIECCVDTPYNPTSQGCCNGVVYGTNSFDCCGGIVFDMYSGSECCGDAIDGNIFLRSEAEAIYGAEAPVGDSVDSGVCCGTHRVPSSDYCCGDDIITMAASAENSAATVPLSSREKISVPVVVSWESSACITVAGKGKSGNPEPDMDEELCIPNGDLQGDNFEGYSVPIGESIGKGNTLKACVTCTK